MREAFLHVRRNVTPGQSFVRCVKAPTGTTPGEFALVDRETVAWSLDLYGRPVRLWYHRVDVQADGCGPWDIDPMYPLATAYDPADIKLHSCARPIRDREVSDTTKIEEEYHRRPARLHWAAYHVEQDRLRAEQQQAAQERVHREHLEFLVRNRIPVPKPKPRTTWLDRLLGRRR